MPDLTERLSKAFRVRGDGARRIYHGARVAARLLRDAPRRGALRQLGTTAFAIPADSGFLVLPPDAFTESGEIVRDAHEALARFEAGLRPESRSRKQFLVNVLDTSTVTTASSMIRFALRDDVLTAVSQYLGVVPFLSSIAVFYSPTMDRSPISSQLHHCDGDDIRQIKVFVYGTDVTAASGPLTVLSADESARVRRATGYQYRQRLTDEQVADVLGDRRERPIVGPSGTTSFVDTSRCFHFGARVAPSAPARLMTVIQYQTPYAFTLPRHPEQSLPFLRLVSPEMGALQRLALGAER
jgi:hypothetical protein